MGNPLAHWRVLNEGSVAFVPAVVRNDIDWVTHEVVVSSSC